MIAAGHDIDLALASDWVVALKDGEVMAMGVPEDIINGKVLSELYGVDVEVFDVDGRRLIYVRDEFVK
ncbi:hypothetical protein [Vulcanisaeta distributa]|uniref:hypothetical protein n=1 Tax=Vulcanisaeta distributa TaxID=164451 RepID=UPI0006D13C52|nr:hypothetical protein [Vulcanisaeta distributa]